MFIITGCWNENFDDNYPHQDEVLAVMTGDNLAALKEKVGEYMQTNWGNFDYILAHQLVSESSTINHIFEDDGKKYYTHTPNPIEVW